MSRGADSYILVTSPGYIASYCMPGYMRQKTPAVGAILPAGLYGKPYSPACYMEPLGILWEPYSPLLYI